MKEWTKLQSTNTPTRRYGHVLVAYQNQIFLFGGTSNDTLKNDLFSLDLGNLFFIFIFFGYFFFFKLNILSDKNKTRIYKYLAHFLQVFPHQIDTNHLWICFQRDLQTHITDWLWLHFRNSYVEMEYRLSKNGGEKNEDFSRWHLSKMSDLIA